MLRHAILSLALLSAPVVAAAPTDPGPYRAEPVGQFERERFVARDNLWRCADAACVSGRGPARPAIVCATLVREIGALRSFSVAGRAFGPEELENCNRRAR